MFKDMFKSNGDSWRLEEEKEGNSWTEWLKRWKETLKDIFANMYKPVLLVLLW